MRGYSFTIPPSCLGMSSLSVDTRTTLKRSEMPYEARYPVTATVLPTGRRELPCSTGNNFKRTTAYFPLGFIIVTFFLGQETTTKNARLPGLIKQVKYRPLGHSCSAYSVKIRDTHHLARKGV